MQCGTACSRSAARLRGSRLLAIAGMRHRKELGNIGDIAPNAAFESRIHCRRAGFGRYGDSDSSRIRMFIRGVQMREGFPWFTECGRKMRKGE